MQDIHTVDDTHGISERGREALLATEETRYDVLALQEMEFAPDPSDGFASESTASEACHTMCCCWC